MNSVILRILFLFTLRILILCAYGISECVFMYFLCFYFESFSVFCLLFPTYIYLLLYFLDACVFSEKGQERAGIWIHKEVGKGKEEGRKGEKVRRKVGMWGDLREQRGRETTIRIYWLKKLFPINKRKCMNCLILLKITKAKYGILLRLMHITPWLWGSA